MNKTENELMHKAVERCIERGKGNGSLYSLYSKGFSRGYKQGSKASKVYCLDDDCNNDNCPRNIHNAPDGKKVTVGIFDDCEERI